MLKNGLVNSYKIQVDTNTFRRQLCQYRQPPQQKVLWSYECFCLAADSVVISLHYKHHNTRPSWFHSKSVKALQHRPTTKLGMWRSQLKSASVGFGFCISNLSHSSMDVDLTHDHCWFTKVNTEYLFTHVSIHRLPNPSSRQYLSCDACLEVKRKDNQNCSLLNCVRQLCTMISCGQFLQFSGLGFIMLGSFHCA